MKIIRNTDRATLIDSVMYSTSDRTLNCLCRYSYSKYYTYYYTLEIASIHHAYDW